MKINIYIMAVPIFMVSLFLMFLVSGLTVYATGEGNADAGGGFGGGEFIAGYTQWKGGSNYEGVRVTIMDISTGRKAAPSVDFSNGANMLRTSVRIHFGKVDKRDRHLGAGLNMFFSNYSVYAPEKPLPRIIGTAGNIEAVKDFFCDSVNLQWLSSHLGFDFDLKTGGGYMLLFEPIMYFHRDGLLHAATATERAMMGGDWMPTTTRERLPLSSFLEFDEPDFGFVAWHGSTSGVQTLENMFTYHGMGKIRFRGEPSPPVETRPTVDFFYLTDTWVYTYIDIVNNNNYGFPHSPYKFGEGEQYGNSPLSVTFHTPAGDMTYNLNIGAHSEGRAFVRWKTPSSFVSARVMNVTVSHPANISYSNPTFVVVEPAQSRPPDPEARDRHNGFVRPHYDRKYNVTSASWKINELNGWRTNMQLKYLGVFSTTNVPTYRSSGVNWAIHRGSQVTAAIPAVYVDEEIGYWDRTTLPWVFVVTGTQRVRVRDSVPATHRYFANVDRGHWIHRRVDHSANISGSLHIRADEKVPTATNRGKRMRSGYGFNAEVVFTTNNPTYCTNIQNVQVFFPEFNYTDGFPRATFPLDGRYWRWLERMPEGSGRFQFHRNPWSTYERRVHFTPVWFPDGAYTVRADCFGAWTPGGELMLTLSDTITIHGSVFDDWHVAPAW